MQSGPADERPADGWDRVWSHRERLLKVARLRSMNVQEAEDAVHEAMIRAVERNNVDDERLGAWLTTVTMRVCIDRFRQVNREAEVHTRSVLGAPGQATVEEAVCDRAEAKWLADRSADLPPHQEEVLALRAQGLDLTQIAQRMGLSYRAVQSLLARARKTLRAALVGTLAIAAWLWPRAMGGGAQGAQTAALVSAAVTLTIAGIGLTTPAEAGTGRSRGPMLAVPSRQAPSVPSDSEYGPALPTDLGAGIPPTGGAASGPSNPPGAALPTLPTAADPTLPTVPDALTVVAPVVSAAPTFPDDLPTLVESVELDDAPAGVPGNLPTAEAPLLRH